MNFVLSPKRNIAIESMTLFKNKKINSIFGPYGNGKTTTLILLSKLMKSICYLNLKDLYIYKDKIRICKYQLFFL